jgi:hypothetical protein
LCDKASLVSHKLTILPLFILKNSFGSCNIHIIRRLN